MKKMLLLSFPPETTCNSITYNIIKKFDVKVNIIRASIVDNAHGFLLMDVDVQESELIKIIDYLNEMNVQGRIIESVITIDRDKCCNCGACTAVCTVDAIYMNDEWELEFDNEKCLDCKSCIQACPARAITNLY